MIRRVCLSALSLACAALLACDSANNPLAPSGTVLTITAVPTQISLTGEGSRITIIGVKPDGNPINPGTQVTLSTSLGVLRPANGSCSDSEVVGVVEADSRGRASLLLCGDGRSGEATVTANLTSAGGGGDGGGTGSAQVTVQIGQNDTSRPTLVINANPTVVPVGGCSRITLIGRSVDGSPVGAGQRIRLTANLGDILCPAVNNANCPANPPSRSCTEVFTDANGEAEVTFRAGDRSGDGQVTAILGTGEPGVVTIGVNAGVDRLLLNASPSVVDRDDGRIILEAIVTDALGIGLRNVAVQFESFYDPDGPNVGDDPILIGSLDPQSDLTDTNGIAMSVLTFTRAALNPVPAGGTWTISASARSEGVESSASIDIQVRAGD